MLLVSSPAVRFHAPPPTSLFNIIARDETTTYVIVVSFISMIFAFGPFIG